MPSKFLSFLGGLTSLLSPHKEEDLDLFQKREKQQKNNMGHKATVSLHPHRMRGVGFTRKDKEQTKVRRKMAKESRRINRRH